ncbi:MAG: glycoside hydrolase family 13 protein [Rhodothermales bacterium]|nr:glycoside hydrolase family 13 protein [Rhodothermales bacterium]MBO6778465.1 glycoside hydrolase family 13 protein [Rhodothermales bacterium]
MKRIALAALFAIGCAGAAQPGDQALGPAGSSNTVPAWAADVIWYQIFPERFRNGDPTNDPPRTSLPSPERIPESWELSRWTSDWYERMPWEEERHPDHFRTVRDRRYGGDLQGVIDGLDYLRDLGVTGIYFNPLFQARSEHKYDGNTYHHIDPYFGPDPEGDFALMATETSDPATWHMTAADSLFFAMVDAAHQRGMRVIIDGVFNHTGRDFFAFTDLREKQQESAYVDWYKILAWDDPASEEEEFDWEGWWGAKSLPEFADNEAGTNLHPGPKEYVFDATRRWMDPNGDGDTSDGVDGWRLDVVADVPVGFWAEWNAFLRTLRPDAYTVAELWEDASETIEAGGFSASMNYYGFAFPTKGYLIDGRMAPSDFVAALTERLGAHRPEVAHAVQNLIDSHDTDRVASMIVNARRDLPYAREDWDVWFDYDWGARNSASDEAYPVEAPSAEDRAIQRMVALFQMTFPGSPMVYYGTEAGMWGADDPDDRQPMWWPEMEFDPVSFHPRRGPIDPIPVGFDGDVFEHYQRAIALRRSHPSLRRGSFEIVHADDASGTAGFERALDDERVIVLLNRSDSPQTIGLEALAATLAPNEGLYVVHTTGTAPTVTEVGVTLEPLTGAAFLVTGTE